MKNSTIFEQYYNEEKSKDLCFNIYAYSPPRITTTKEKGVGYGKDYRTVERYREYKEAGFNMVLMQLSGNYYGEEWETSQCKLVMDRAYEAGIEKVIVYDERLMHLTLEEDGVVGEGKTFSQRVANVIGEGRTFATQADLENYVAECIVPYKDHPAFYGVQLKDEPSWENFKAVGEVYRAIKKVDETIFIQCNLFPYVGMGGGNVLYPHLDDGGDMQQRYADYLNEYLDATGADYIMYDDYPIRENRGYGTALLQLYFLNLQIAAQVCKERSVKFYFVMQSTSLNANGFDMRKPDESEMFYQLNVVLGFGVKEFSYWKYFTGDSDNTVFDAAMLSRLGEKTELYNYVKRANAMAQKLAPVLMNFEYVTDRYVIKMPFKSHPFHLYYTRRGFLKHIVKSQTSQEVALISELYDKEKAQYLYKIQNITCNYYEKQLELPKQKTTVTFSSEFNKVDVFDGKKWTTQNLDNGTYSVELKAGYAVYLLPY